MPEMMRLAAADGYKVKIKEGDNITEYSGNRDGAKNEFVFDLDDWRTQIGNNIFTHYAGRALNNAQDPNSNLSYTKMYESVVVKNREELRDNTNKLNGKKDEMIAALKIVVNRVMKFS